MRGRLWRYLTYEERDPSFLNTLAALRRLIVETVDCGFGESIQCEKGGA